MLAQGEGRGGVWKDLHHGLERNNVNIMQGIYEGYAE